LSRAGRLAVSPAEQTTVVDASASRYLDDLVAAARGVLADNLVAAYAAGSLALDAYQPGRSDVDVALICEAKMAGTHKNMLVSTLRHEALPCPARGLELVVYRREVAQSGRSDPAFELELNTGPRMEFRATYDPTERPSADGTFWYALDRSILHQSGRVIFGPPATEMFADLSRHELQRSLLAALEWWLARPAPDDEAPAPGADDAVLGACRSLVKYRDGRWLSKVDAGRRVAAAGLWPELIARAIAARSGGPALGGREARLFQAWVLEQLKGDD
jgi:hypothetical protein